MDLVHWVITSNLTKLGSEFREKKYRLDIVGVVVNQVDSFFELFKIQVLSREIILYRVMHIEVCLRGGTGSVNKPPRLHMHMDMYFGHRRGQGPIAAGSAGPPPSRPPLPLCRRSLHDARNCRPDLLLMMPIQDRRGG